MKNVLLMFFAVSSAAALVGCSSGSSSSGTADPNVGCPSGSSFSNGVCVNSIGQVVSSGVGFVSNNFNSGVLTITNQSLYQTFLKEALSICDQGSYNAGASACSSYANSAINITLQAMPSSPSSARLTIEVVPTGYTPYNFSVNFGTGGIAYDPLPLNLVVSQINNSQGLEGRANGAYGTIAANKLIQIFIPNQTLNSQYLDYQLAYNGSSGGVFATGRMLLCSDPSCGGL